MQQSPTLICVQLYYPQLDKQRIVVTRDSSFILAVSGDCHLQMDWNMAIKLFKNTKKTVCFKYSDIIIILLLKIVLIILMFMKNIPNAFIFGK